MSQVNPPSAAVMKQALAVIVQRQEATKTNIQKTKTELANLQKKNASLNDTDRCKKKIKNLETELANWPTTYETELKRWLLAQPSIKGGSLPSLPQEIKNEISKYLQTTRIAQIEREVLKKK